MTIILRITAVSVLAFCLSPWSAAESKTLYLGIAEKSGVRAIFRKVQGPWENVDPEEKKLKLTVSVVPGKKTAADPDQWHRFSPSAKEAADFDGNG